MIARNRTLRYLFALTISGAVLLGGALFAPLSQAQQRSNVQSLEGVISDSMCGASHKEKNPAECALACVRNGKAWVLVVADKIYTLEGRMAGISNMAGQKAKITGRVTGDKINVTEIAVPD